MTQDNTNLIETAIHADLHHYLQNKTLVDELFPDAPDLEALWPKIGESYLPDGMREFGTYPTVALGWIMYVGMALAKYWDQDWELYSRVPDLYKHLRDAIDFDHMDDYICRQILVLSEPDRLQLQQIVAECAARTSNLLAHQSLEPGTAEAFRAFVAALHQMYLMGIAVQLKTMGYHMTKL